VLGVSYKGGVGDPRYSPSTEIIQRLRDKGLNVRVHDPLVTRYGEPLMSLEDAVRGADLIAVLVDHPGFMQIDARAVAQLMRGASVIDGRNVLDVEAWESAGLTVERLGAP
jgi:UDP-N-acetyl-D-mannosaminuronate dehydrogenase